MLVEIREDPLLNPIGIRKRPLLRSSKVERNSFNVFPGSQWRTIMKII